MAGFWVSRLQSSRSLRSISICTSPSLHGLATHVMSFVKRPARSIEHTSMLLLPTGQVLFAAQTNAIYAYTYFSSFDLRRIRDLGMADWKSRRRRSLVDWAEWADSRGSVGAEVCKSS